MLLALPLQVRAGAQKEPALNPFNLFVVLPDCFRENAGATVGSQDYPQDERECSHPCYLPEGQSSSKTFRGSAARNVDLHSTAATRRPSLYRSRDPPGGVRFAEEAYGLSRGGDRSRTRHDLRHGGGHAPPNDFAETR